MGPAARGPGSAGRRLLAHELDAAPAGPAVRRLQVRGRPDHRPSRAASRAPAAQAVPQGHRADRGRHPGAHPRPQRSPSSRRTTATPPPTRSSSTPTPASSSRSAGRCPATGNDCRGWEGSGAKAAVGNTIDDRRRRLPGHRPGHPAPPRSAARPNSRPGKRNTTRSHRKVRARVEHTFARMKTWKILRDCRLKGDGVHHAMLGIARLHNLAHRDSQRPAWSRMLMRTR